MSVIHSVFVLALDGKPLSPTTPCHARKLLAAKVAKKAWSKFNTFGIQMLVETRRETPEATLGYDVGTKFEGFSVVCGQENNLSVKLDLPDKKKIVRKLDERQCLRGTRRNRNCRRRECRSLNRARVGFLTPSQAVIVNSRLRVLRAFFAIYPIKAVGMEDVRFNHAKYRWGANFSTCEIGKTRLRNYFRDTGCELLEYRGFETKELREKYGYKKTSDKGKDVFTAHCSDALALACEVGPGERIEPGVFVAVDDTYRCVRRKLHDTQPAKGGLRANYSKGTVFGLRKGLLIGASKGRQGRLCGELKGSYRYYNESGKRQSAKQLTWISSQFVVKEGVRHSAVA
jgi:hypothetical protein